MPFAAAFSSDAALVLSGRCTEAKPARAATTRSTTPRVRRAVRTINRQKVIAPLPFWLEQAGADCGFSQPAAPDERMPPVLYV
jgi:hypothetical protein